MYDACEKNTQGKRRTVVQQKLEDQEMDVQERQDGSVQAAFWTMKHPGPEQLETTIVETICQTDTREDIITSPDPKSTEVSVETKIHKEIHYDMDVKTTMQKGTPMDLDAPQPRSDFTAEGNYHPPSKEVKNRERERERLLADIREEVTSGREDNTSATSNDEPKPIVKTMSGAFVELKKSEKWGVSVCTVDGQRAHFGDSDYEFPTQNCVLPMLYAACLNEHGSDYVHQYCGREPAPTGRMRANKQFELSQNGVPHNALINSGAITVGGIYQQGKQNSVKIKAIHKTISEIL